MYGADTRQLSCGFGYGGAASVSWLGFGGENGLGEILPPHFAFSQKWGLCLQLLADANPQPNMTFSASVKKLTCMGVEVQGSLLFDHAAAGGPAGRRASISRSRPEKCGRLLDTSK